MACTRRAFACLVSIAAAGVTLPGARSASASPAARIELIDGPSFQVEDWGCVWSAPREAAALIPGTTAYYRYDDREVGYVPLHHGPLVQTDTVSYTIPAVVVHLPFDRIERIDHVARPGRIDEVAVVLTDGKTLNGYLRDMEGFNEHEVTYLHGKTSVGGLEATVSLQVSASFDHPDYLRQVRFRRDQNAALVADLRERGGRLHEGLSQLWLTVEGGDSSDDTAPVSYLSVEVAPSTWVRVPLDQLRSAIRSLKGDSLRPAYEDVLTLVDGKQVRGAIAPTCLIEGKTTFLGLPARFNAHVENVRSISTE